MEPAEHIYEEWSSLSGVYTAEEADFMNQLLGNCSVPEHHLYGDFNWGTGNDIISYFPAQGSSSSNADSGNIFPTTTSGGNYYSNNQVTNFGCMAVPFSLGDPKFSLHSVQGNDSKQINENTDEEFGLDGDKNLQAHKECEILVSESEEDKVRGKRSRRSSIEVPKNKRNVKSKKNSESACISNTKEDTSPGPQGQTLSSYCSDDDSNASQELNGGASLSLSPDDSTALKLSGKSRSNIRVPATDPQSVYARRRRERINERLRILQKLVPNGTKVDISTMLEEAVQYVKFLQLQIKLLSSEDLWMYAPIAYNGMNIGLQLNITLTKQPKQMHT